MPAVVRRKTFVTIRHRFTPAITFSTTTRVLERRCLRNLSSTLNSWPFGFFGLSGQPSRWLIALQARVLVERGIGRIGNLLLIGGFLVVLFAGHGRSQIDHFGSMLVHQHEILIRMRFLLAAVLLLLLGGIGGTLATALRAVDGHIRGALERQGAGGTPARVALRRHTEGGSGPWQEGQQGMNPVVGLGWAQL